jgi:pyruvate/2-oxoglutarate dehydrogenase complex dihydrolipoamide acyltransferase (E2) component
MADDRASSARSMGGSGTRASWETMPTSDGFFHIGDVFAKEINRNYLYFVLEVNADAIDRRRAAAREDGKAAPSYTTFAVHAIGTALRDHPDLNCMICERPFGQGLKRLDDVTATVAVEREVDGIDMVLALPIRGVDRMTLEEIHTSLRRMTEDEVAARAEVRQLLALNKIARYSHLVAGAITKLPRLSKDLWQKYRGGSFVVTSPGKYGGADVIIPTWPWPLTFAFGSIKPRPVVEDGLIVARNTIKLTLAVDRRLANGAPLARFAEQIRVQLESAGPQT